jgi:hypothetical protein
LLKKSGWLVRIFFCRFVGFLRVVLGKVGVWMWFLDGKYVVERVVNVVS